jgi:hypothetical protein
MLVLAAKGVKLVQNGIELVFQAGDTLVESAIAVRRTSRGAAGRHKLRPARTESAAKSTGAKSAAATTCADTAATTTSTTAGLWTTRRGRSIIAIAGPAGFWTAIAIGRATAVRLAIARRPRFATLGRTAVAILLGAEDSVFIFIRLLGRDWLEATDNRDGRDRRGEETSNRHV